MKHSGTLYLILLIAGAACCMSVAEDAALEAALEAQKTKAPRRVYSERAIEHEQNLIAAAELSEEEELLDEALRKKEAEMDRSFSLTQPQPIVPRRVVQRSVRVKQSNWLLPEMNEEDEELSISPEEKSWLIQELERQQETQQEQISLLEEEELLREQLRDEQRRLDTQRKSSLQFDLIQNKILTGRDNDTRTSPGSSPGLLSPLSSFRDQPRSEPSPFSTDRSRENSGIIQNPFDLETIRKNKLLPAPKKSPFDLSSDRRTQKKKPLSPLESIKKSSSIHREDPFEDDPLPTFKSSIWD